MTFDNAIFIIGLLPPDCAYNSWAPRIVCSCFSLDFGRSNRGEKYTLCLLWTRTPTKHTRPDPSFLGPHLIIYPHNLNFQGQFKVARRKLWIKFQSVSGLHWMRTTTPICQRVQLAVLLLWLHLDKTKWGSTASKGVRPHPLVPT